MSEYIVNCRECQKPFPVDAKWKDLCYHCYLKTKNPKKYKEHFEMADITCVRCGKVFVDEAWKDLCYPCFIIHKKELELEDLEEREQFDD
jgi:NMD protein affecting ribosome stability and mRNA decay